MDEKDKAWKALDAEVPQMAQARNLERLGWDELDMEQKIERMRRIVKGIDNNSHEHWRRLEQLGQQMRHHSHLYGVVLVPLDTGNSGYGIAEAKMPGGKVYF